MIEVNDTGVHVEGTPDELLNEWMNITVGLYKNFVKRVGVKKASKVFGDSLCFSANIALIEMEKRGEISEGEYETDS